LRSAKKVFFLGFGYDPQNLEILGIPRLFQETTKPPAIFGTGKGLLSEEIESSRLRLGLDQFVNPIIKDCDCAELLRRYFVGQGDRA
jgi:hypothetical protein